jgi:tetratricopeptide (TPR) repeat protein
MDPITRAMQQFGDDAEAFWRQSPHGLLPLRAHEDQRADVVQALRFYEGRPDNRRPFVVFCRPFEAPSTYFSALAEQIAGDYERVRVGVSEEGVELPAFTTGDDGTVPSGALKRAALAMNKAARLLGDPFAGIVVALVPDHVADVEGWRESVRVLAGTRWSPRVRVAAFDPLGGPLSEILEDGRVLFDVDPGELLGFLAEGVPAGSAGPASEASPEGPVRPEAPSVGAELRRLMLGACAKMAEQRPTDAAKLFEQARALCAAERLVPQEAGALMSLGGAWVAAQMPELAIESYSKAAGLAEQAGEWTMACHAWLGTGGANLMRESYAAAAVAYRAATEAAKQGELPVLRIEALRMAGTCLVRAGCEGAAVLAWKEAVSVGTQIEVEERAASTFEEVAAKLAELLDRRGLHDQAEDVRGLAGRGTGKG